MFVQTQQVEISDFCIVCYAAKTHSSRAKEVRTLTRDVTSAKVFREAK